MSYENPRLKLTDSGMDVMVKMSHGNLGATTVLIQLLEKTPEIDPQDLMAGMGKILLLDTMDIYEDRIWRFYKYVCKQNLVWMLAVMRGYQFGWLSLEAINLAIDDAVPMDIESLEKILERVKEQLPEFDRKEVTVEDSNHTE